VELSEFGVELAYPVHVPQMSFHIGTSESLERALRVDATPVAFPR